LGVDCDDEHRSDGAAAQLPDPSVVPPEDTNT
jgi:hypothetical protein